MRVATHRDGTDLDYNEANGLFSLGEFVVTVQQVAKLDRGRKLHWTSPENREWFQRIAAVDKVNVTRPQRRNGCLIVFAAIGVLSCGLALCSLTTCGAVLNEAANQGSGSVISTATVSGQ